MSINLEQALTDSLQRAKMDGVQIQAILTRYKIEAAKSNDIAAFLSCVDHWADENPHVLLASLIEDALRKANETKIETNPLVRTKNYVEQHNKWLEHADKLGIEGVTPLDAEKLKMKMPSYIKSEPENEAKASFDVKSVKGLELEVRQ